MATPIITVNPPPNVLGIPLGTKISIVFEAEMDVGSILDGNIVITGISDRLFSGPDIALFVDTTSGAYDPPLLTTPTFTGPVEYSLEIERIDPTTLLPVTIVDDGNGVSSGSLYYTKVILTPLEILKPLVKYGVIISDNVSIVTIFDPVYSFDPASSGKIIVTGPYSGSSEDIYHIEIVSGTTYKDIVFKWWKDSSPLDVFTVNSANKRSVFLENNLFANFDLGTFVAGDTASYKVVPSDGLTTITSWSFTTGSGAIIAPVSSEPTTITNLNISDAPYSGGDVLSEGEVSYVWSTPVNLSYQVPLQTTTILFGFGASIDQTTIQNSKINIYYENLYPDVFDPQIGREIKVLGTVIGGSGDTLAITIQGLVANCLYRAVIDSGAFSFVDGSSVGKSTLLFLSSFSSFYAPPSYVIIKGGGVLNDVPEILLAENIGITSLY